MKVAQIRTEFTDNGPGSQTLTIANELSSRGHSVTFFSSGGCLTNKILSCGHKYKLIEELSINKRSLFSVLTAVRKLRRYFIKESFDIIHAHNSASVLLANIALIGFANKPRVYQSVRGVEVRKFYGWRNLIYRVISFDKLFAVSRYTKDILVGFGVPENKVVVTYNGTDLERFNIKYKLTYRDEIRREFSIPEDKVIVGLVGRQDGNKGHKHLISVVSELKDKHPNLVAILVGDGSEMASNISYANSLDINDRIIFTGLRLDVEKLHASFDIFTLFSKKGLEMFPNVLVEAMTYAIPFVATDTAGVKEAAENGSGIICQCDDVNSFIEAIDNLLSDDAKRYEMGLKGRSRVESELNIGEVVNKIVDSYCE